MKISYKHLSNFIPDTSMDNISDALFQLGHEHDIKKDVFDIEFTPNRGDCLSVHGLARDLKNHFTINNNIDIYSEDITDLELNFNNKSIENCPFISFLEIETDGSVNSYSNYIKNFFEDTSSNSINLFTDISNYVSYELGQPSHCYDLEKMSKDISFEKLQDDESFLSLHNEVINLKKGEFVFKSDGNIINFAGIMGAKATSCENNTKKVLVEFAYFPPENILGKTIKYNINSDAAYKFERGVDPKLQDIALKRFINVLGEHTNIISLKQKKYIFKKIFDKKISNDIHKINQILGTNINSKDITSILENLGFIVDDHIRIPSYRNDIHHLNDIAEEVARVIGYNQIDEEPIDLNVKTSNINKYFNQDIKSYLIGNNFNEVINNPFTNYKEEFSIIVDNPLDSNNKYLRVNLMNSLILNLKYNFKRQHDSIKFFEISNLYDSNTSTRNLGMIVAGRLGNNYLSFSKTVDEKYFEKLISPLKDIGPFYTKQFSYADIGIKGKGKVFYFEAQILKTAQALLFSKDFVPDKYFNKYKKISEFPSSYRDLSIATSNKLAFDALMALFESYESELLKNKFLFDFYQDKNNKIIKIGYRFVFQSVNKTLNDKEIDGELKRFIDGALAIEGLSIPGI